MNLTTENLWAACTDAFFGWQPSGPHADETRAITIELAAIIDDRLQRATSWDSDTIAEAVIESDGDLAGFVTARVNNWPPMERADDGELVDHRPPRVRDLVEAVAARRLENREWCCDCGEVYADDEATGTWDDPVCAECGDRREQSQLDYAIEVAERRAEGDLGRFSPR